MKKKTVKKKMAVREDPQDFETDLDYLEDEVRD